MSYGRSCTHKALLLILPWHVLLFQLKRITLKLMMVSVDVVYFTVMEILGGHERSVAIVGQGDEAEDGRWGDPRRPRSEAAGNGPGNMLHEDPDTLAV